ncbi:MAG: hypothetical protein CL489_08920 [Acidobacteria bacterium]|nr:hypothetical protein [Acidobacteriota bacterium]|tara:strand:- start:41908 stop:42117 length:210 start_codon:yes stop_codon:yes gene_type:complete
MFEVNDRVKTKFGNGTIEYFEILAEKCYFVTKLDDDIKNYRICVRLDEGHTWAFKDQLCCFYESELELM